MCTNTDSPTFTYRDAGVDIKAGEALVDQIKPFAKRTMRPEVMSSIGGFGSLFEMPKKFKEPVLVSGTDGVGTKLKLAFELNMHDTVGIDLVAMSVNDILVQGAEPLFFLDYFACGKLDVGTAANVVKGIANGCEESGCALVGGETAEMPGMYPAGEYDLAGFAVGCVDKGDIIDGTTISAGDTVLGLASSGAHSNGYSLIRKIIESSGIDMESDFHGRKFKDVVMAPTKLYVKSILKLLQANAKLTIKEIGQKLNLSSTPIFERIKRLERSDYISAYRATISRRKIGLSLMVFCDISLNQHETSYISKFEQDIQQFPEVIECYHIGGTFDYLIKVVAKDMDEYQYFIANKLASLDNIRKVQSSFVMNEVKSTAGLPIT